MTTPSVASKLSADSLLLEARERWRLADACLECNASDVAHWRQVVEFIEAALLQHKDAMPKRNLA